MTLYRAMCEEEAATTLRAGKPQFLRRLKWFSPDLSLIRGRVQDGRFNNSRFVPERYVTLLGFELLAGEDQFTVRGMEWKLDRRRSHQVRWGKVNYVPGARTAEECSAKDGAMGETS